MIISDDIPLSIDKLMLNLITVLKKAFEAFDHEKKGCIGTVMVGTILGMLGHQVTDESLQEIINEVDVDGKTLYQLTIIPDK